MATRPWALCLLGGVLRGHGEPDSGGYRLFSLFDEQGPEPEPGQFYMVATERHWEQAGARPFLPRALSVADAEPRARRGAGSIS